MNRRSRLVWYNTFKFTVDSQLSLIYISPDTKLHEFTKVRLNVLTKLATII